MSENLKKRGAVRLGCEGSLLRVREAGEGQPESRTIEGLAIVFDKPSVVMVDWWDGPYREYIDREAVSQEMLDGCDIKMTAFHDREILLARHWPVEMGLDSTLRLEVREDGVWVSFEAPRCPWGDNILESVRLGNMRGMSFSFYENAYTYEDVQGKDGIIDRHIRHFSEIVEMTVAADPAYPDTTAEARERERLRQAEAEKQRLEAEKKAEEARIREAAARAEILRVRKLAGRR